MFARLSQFAVIALASVLGGQAYAGPTIYGTYYDETATSSCNGNACQVNFSQLRQTNS